MLEQDIQITNLAHAYRVLDVPHDASPRAIKAAYRQLVKRWHPDRYKPGSAEQADATLMTRLLNAAYARIEDAPLQAGHATPFSAPRSATTGSQPSPIPHPPHSDHPQDGIHTEYGVHENKEINEAFYRILAQNRKAKHSVWDDVSWGRVEHVVDSILGGVCGAILGAGMAQMTPDAPPTTIGIVLRAVLGAFIGGGISRYFGFPKRLRYYGSSRR
jgi:hypothetical protein